MRAERSLALAAPGSAPEPGLGLESKANATTDFRAAIVRFAD
jgi:hypothetical protein